MQIIEAKPRGNMTRDMELIRSLLLWVDREPQLDGKPGRYFALSSADEVGAEGRSFEEIAYHLRLLIEAGFLVGSVNPATGIPVISRLTWSGHEFLDDIRDTEIWAKTKERVSGLASIALSVVGEIAKAEIKKKLGLPS